MKPRTVFAVALCVVMFSAGFYLLAFGGAVFCCAPIHPGGGFWQMEKFSYGLLPLCASLVALTFTSRFLARTFIRRRNAWLAGCILAGFAMAQDLTLFLKYRGRQDDDIRLTWQSESGTFSWGSGQVRLPAGFTYRADHGIDTFVGHFTSQDGKLVIDHDIGELAGEHGGAGRSETLKEGSRVRLGRARSDREGSTTFFSKVSFPDNGCANFYVESPNENDLAVIDFIAKTFRPASPTPSWVRPLLPEVLRSDCRYRLKLPGGS
jgi:hypothetical protein